MPRTNAHGPPNPDSVAGLLRVSSAEQRDGDTIEIQRDYLAQYRELYKRAVADR